jgi:hypothetical protein
MAKDGMLGFFKISAPYMSQLKIFLPDLKLREKLLGLKASILTFLRTNCRLTDVPMGHGKSVRMFAH